MAKLEVKTIPPVPAKPVEEFILTLSREEAGAVFSLVGSVTGSSDCSRRRYTNSVYEALKSKLGIAYEGDMEARGGGYFGTHFKDVEGIKK